MKGSNVEIPTIGQQQYADFWVCEKVVESILFTIPPQALACHA
jgi:hypothetical protein